MKAAKTLVWVMSGMLVALLGVLVVGLSLGWHKDTDTAAGPMTTEENARRLQFQTDNIALGEPAGTEIESVLPVGGFLALSLSGGGEGARVVVIDPQTGAVVARISVETLQSEDDAAGQ